MHITPELYQQMLSPTRGSPESSPWRDAMLWVQSRGVGLEASEHDHGNWDSKLGYPVMFWQCISSSIVYRVRKDQIDRLDELLNRKTDMLTTEERKLGSTENAKPWALMSAAQQAAIRKAKAIGLAEFLGRSGNWNTEPSRDEMHNHLSYRIKPETQPTDYVDIEVRLDNDGDFAFSHPSNAIEYSITAAPAIPICLGIVYELDGIRTLRTSCDIAFGVPKAVRLRN